MALDRTNANLAKERSGNLETLTKFEREGLRLLEEILAELRALTSITLSLGGPIQDDPERLKDLDNG